MNQLLQISACAVTLLLSTSFMAQGQVKEDFVPSTKNHPGKEYPMVNSQGYARFKVDAPEAKSVTVTLGLGGSGGTKLEKQADGSWMGTTAGPMDEGFHYYHLIVDDGTFNDPGTLNYFGLFFLITFLFFFLLFFLFHFITEIHHSLFDFVFRTFFSFR